MSDRCVPCETKIILNGRRIYVNAEMLCDTVREERDRVTLPQEAALKVIKHLNAAEDAIDAATREYIRGIGFEGPVNKALQ